MADNPNVGRPSSGSYGELAKKEALEEGVAGNGRRPPPPQGPRPGGGPPTTIEGRAAGQPPRRGATPPVTQRRGEEGRPRIPTGPPGVPPALLAQQGQGPSFNMGGTQMDPVGQAAGVPPEQRTLYILDVLASSQEVSAATREWASEVRDVLAMGTR